MPATFNYIDTADKLDALFAESYEHPVALLKHSSSCGISAHTMYQLDETDALVSVLVVQDHRELSNVVAMRTGYRHQTPQAFVLRDGRSIYQATHYAIDPQKVAELIK